MSLTIMCALTTRILSTDLNFTLTPLLHHIYCCVTVNLETTRGPSRQISHHLKSGAGRSGVSFKIWVQWRKENVARLA